jgi:hypothetical protein
MHATTPSPQCACVHPCARASLHVAGEVEYPEFIEIMTTTLSRMEEERRGQEDGDAPPMPFALLATAYRCGNNVGQAAYLGVGFQY